MFQKKTFIVVGAGASKEVNLPTGYELKQRIAEILDIRFGRPNSQVSGDPVVCEAIRRASKRADSKAMDLRMYFDAALRIRDGMPLAMSIDHFIDAHRGDSRVELCGKLAIVRSILHAEMKSLLYFDASQENSSPNFRSLDGTWFNAFMQLLTENCRTEQLDERLSSIGLIIFNYDRCIEHFLYHAVQTYYGIDADRAGTLVQRIEIYHPYGAVGALPWYGREPAVEFGAQLDAKQLLNVATEINTFTEGTDPNSSDVVKIRKGMAESQIVLFLGFAFHRLNLTLIQPPENTHSEPEAVRYFGTAKGISNSDRDVIASELVELGGAKLEKIALRNDLSCFQLFQEYWRSLSLAG